MHRLDVVETVDAAVFAPGEKITHRSSVGLARVRIADIGDEEFEEPFRSGFTFIGDQPRNRGGTTATNPSIFGCDDEFF